MRVVAYSDHFLSSRPQGLKRYAFELSSALEARDVSMYRMASGAQSDEAHSSPPVYILPGSRRRRVLQGLTHLARPLEGHVHDGDVDAVHFMSPTYPVRHTRPAVVTVHDLGPITHPQFFAKAYPFLMRRHIEQLRSEGATFIATSSWTCSVLAEEFGVDSDVTWEGVSSAFLPDNVDSDRADARGQRPYVLTVGAMNPRKNMGRLFESIRRYGLPYEAELVVAGTFSWGVEDERHVLEELVAAGLARFIESPPDEVLAQLYRDAVALVFPSLYEGFGLPAIEAMASGCPVLSSPSGALREVTEEAALWCDPMDIDSISLGLWRIMEDDALRLTLRRRGLDRSAAFSWDKTAEKTEAIYRTTVSDARGRGRQRRLD